MSSYAWVMLVNRQKIYPAIFAISCAALVLEVSLTRLFSIYLSYHFAFMVLSIAMLGIGCAGTVLAVYPKLKNGSFIGAYAALAGLAVLVGYLISNNISFDPIKLSWDIWQIFVLAIYCLSLSLPFFFAGLLIASVFSLHSEQAGRIYSADLLGAGFGSVAALGLLHIASPEYAVFVSSVLCFVAALIAGGKRVRVAALILIVVVAGAVLVRPAFLGIRLSPYKNLSLALKFPGARHLNTYYNSFSRVDTLESPAVRFAPGLSFSYLKPLPKQIGLSVDGSSMNAVTYTVFKDDLAFVEQLPSALAYEIRKGDNEENVLILEPKGGLNVLTAEQYGFKNLYKVESNPLLVDVVRDVFGAFSGNIYERNTFKGLGRSWLRREESARFGIIDLAALGTTVGGGFGISEDYLFTVEAFEEYLNALDEDGAITISLYLAPPARTELRTLATAIAALEKHGVSDVSRHLAAIRSWDVLTLIVANEPLAQNEIENIRDFAEKRRFDLVYVPGIKASESNRYIKMPGDEYFKSFKDIIDPATRSQFITSYLFDIAPVHDDNPFFHYYLKLKNIGEIYDVMGEKWQYFIEEGYLLPAILLQVVVLCAILILLPVILRRVTKKPKLSKWPTLVYFGMIGLAFMFVEVTLIQRCILVLDYPAHAFAIVITAVLVSAGLGSRMKRLAKAPVILVLAALALIYGFLFPLWLDVLATFVFPVRIAGVFISLLPLGFLMGIPFPLAIKLVGQKDEGLIPWAWAINGCFSVLAPIIAVMIAMAVGLNAVLLIGAAAYALAFLALLPYLSEQ